jgi:DNA-3-methyladenine glycosylase II
MPEFIIASPITLNQATRQLLHDSVLRPVIETYGQCELVPHTNYYRELIESIVGQQLSVKAAASINRRFVELFNGVFPTPEQILEKSMEELRSAGLSGAKARYIQDLAAHVLAGTLTFDQFDDMTNEQIMAELLPVKGIGEWTAHMFLMFCMGRLDVLPVGDLGIRTGIMKLYGIGQLPTADEIREIANQNNWHPYESVASWYIWQSLDNSPKV